MRGKSLLLAIGVLFITQIVFVPQAHAFFRIEQLIKNTADGELVTYNNSPKYQRLSCDDIVGDIERVVVSLSHQPVSPSFNPYSNYTLEFQGAINQTSEILHVTDTDGGQHDYVFMFSPPVNGANLCAGQSSVVMSIKDGETSYLGRAKLHGSDFSSAYRDANFDCGFSCAIRDWYFIINPKPPVITLLGPSSLILEEGDVYVEPYATAMDPEDGNITSSIVVGGDIVDTHVPGTYSVTYNVADSSGVSAPEVTRTVIVEVVNLILEPTNLEVDSQVNNPYVSAGAPAFSAIFTSPTSTTAVIAYELQVSTSSGNLAVPYFDSGLQTLSSPTPVGVRTPQILGPTFPQDGRSYFWRIRFWDQDGNKGMWSNEESYFKIVIPSSTDMHVLGIQDVANDAIYGPSYAVASVNNPVKQRINCSVIEGNIAEIILTGYWYTFSSGNVVLSDENGHASDPYILSQPINGRALHDSPSFHFQNPIPCISGQELILSVIVSGNGAAIVDGALSEVYPWGECIVLCNNINDIYFQLIGTSAFVPPTNHTPMLDPIGNRTVNEGELIEFAVNATDVDNDVLTYSASNLPLGAAFNTSTGLFSWTPSFNQEGNYADIEFTVTDNGTPMELDTELIMISVGNVNRPPVFAGVGTQAALEGETISFVVSATDPDGDAVVLIASGTPAGASFNMSTGVFSWTPTLAQAGAYVAVFVATDNGVPNLATLLEVPLTIGDNPTPTEQAEAVVDIVVDYNFPMNIENSYLANLKKVAKFIEEGKIAAARNQILAFIDKVENDMAAGVIGQAEGDELLVLANALLEDLQ